MLMVTANLFAIFNLLLWGAMLPKDGEKYDSIWNFSTFFIWANVFFLVLFCCLYNGEYKRLKSDDGGEQFKSDDNKL